MTTYATNNPIGSMDPKDLFDNAQNLDFAVNDITKAIWKDRFGRDRKTYWGMEQAFSAQLLSQKQIGEAQLQNQKEELDAQVLSQEQRFSYFIMNSGYKFVGEYTDGPLTVTDYNQLIRYQNELYKLKADTAVPFTTTGKNATSWVNDFAHFINVADAALRQQIGDPYGAEKYPELQLARWRDEGDVRGWGAIGDGLNDDTDAILLCFADAKLRGGRTKIKFQHGTYLVRGTSLIIDFPNVLLEGNWAKLRLVDSPTVIQGPVLKVAQYGNTSVRGTVENVTIKNLEIDGNKLNQVQTMNTGGDANNPGFVSEDVVNLHVENVISRNCDGYGFLFAGSNLPHRKGAYFKNCWAHGNNVDGFDIKAGFNHVTLDSCRSWDNGYAPMVELRSGMGIDIRGKNVTLLNCVAGDEGSNYAGNFRIRENAQAGISLFGCHSHNSPDGTYGFMCIGGGNTNISLVSCTSTNDGTSLKHERGHVTAVGFRSWKPRLLSVLQYPSQFVLSTLTAAATFTAFGVSVTILPSDYLSATVGSEIKIPTNTGTIYLLVNEAVSSTLVCTVLRGNLGTAAVGASITTVSTGSLTIDGGISYQSASDAMQFASTLQTLTDSSMPVTINGFIIEAPIRYGVNFQGGDVSFFGGAIRNCGKGSSSPGFFVGNAATAESTFRLDSVFMGNDDKSFTQSAGLQFQSTSLAKGSVRACKFADNANSPVIGSPSSGVRFADNIGYTNEGTFSTTIDVTTVGVKTFSIPHGLSKAPSGKDVQLTIQRSGAANDYVLSTPMITGASSTIISGRVSVLTASATTGEAATVNAFISANP
ncbi:hypothetical protein R9J58_24260 [Escherichia coli]|nr:hypothetical protein [Escherichia coli]MSH35056.1 hypothetical protein [Escherichia coli]MSI38680.1 hypothetical protein [Escherichia coli]HAY4514770.1 hypothetical protein [Escherichia coli]